MALYNRSIAIRFVSKNNQKGPARGPVLFGCGSRISRLRRGLLAFFIGKGKNCAPGIVAVGKALVVADDLSFRAQQRAGDEQPIVAQQSQQHNRRQDKATPWEDAFHRPPYSIDARRGETV